MPDGLKASNSMAEAVQGAEVILMVVPTQFVARTMTDMAQLLQPHQVLLCFKFVQSSPPFFIACICQHHHYISLNNACCQVLHGLGASG